MKIKKWDPESLEEKNTKAKSEEAKPRENRKPVPQDLRISARQFVRARGYRWERSAGFLLHVKRDHPGDKTRGEWDQLWAGFWAKPVK